MGIDTGVEAKEVPVGPTAKTITLHELTRAQAKQVLSNLSIPQTKLGVIIGKRVKDPEDQKQREENRLKNGYSSVSLQTQDGTLLPNLSKSHLEISYDGDWAFVTSLGKNPTHWEREGARADQKFGQLNEGDTKSFETDGLTLILPGSDQRDVIIRPLVPKTGAWAVYLRKK